MQWRKAQVFPKSVDGMWDSTTKQELTLFAKYRELIQFPSVPRSWLVPGPSHAQSLHCPGQAGRASSIRWLLTHHWFSEFSELSCLEEDFLRSIFSFDFSEATAKQHAENLYWCRQSLTNILSDQYSTAVQYFDKELKFVKY